jgi:hypothetical protein
VPLAKYGALFKLGVQAQAHVLPARSTHKLVPGTSQSKPGDQLVRDEWPDGTVDVSTGQVIAAASGLQTNNPGWPGFRSRGFLTASVLTLSLLY